MAKVYSTGPVLVYVGLASQAFNPVFLGTGEQAPDIDIDPAYSPVMNDLAGAALPFDRIYDGEEATVNVTLNRFNANVLALIQALPLQSSIPGINVNGDIGTLMGQEGCTYPLWLVFPYSTLKRAYADMVQGYHFYATFLMAPHRIKGGTKDEKVSVVWQCQRAYAIPAGSIGTFALYDTLSTSFANLPGIN